MQTRVPIAIGLVFAVYAGWAALMSTLVPGIYGYPCSQQFFTVTCAFPQDSVEANSAYPALVAFLLVAVVALRLFWRSAAAYPFLILSAALCTAAIAWDGIAVRPVLFSPKIINDTINILGAVIAASFTLIIVLARREAFSVGRLAAAALTSYGLTVLSVSAFVELSRGVFGVTELFLLYVIYAFGSFTLHLMTVCGFVAHLPRAVRSAA